MQVKEVLDLCERFCQRISPERPTLNCSDPWHCGKNRASVRIPQESDAGICLFSAPAKPNWEIPAVRNEEDVWYVGSSHSGLGRVWTHLGKVFNPDTGQPYEEPFADHRWRHAATVSEEIRKSITVGKAVVYTIAIAPVSRRPDWPVIFEMHVLVECYLKYRHLPPLNLGL